MAGKPLSTEAIALTEKKMDMTLGVLDRTIVFRPLLSPPPPPPPPPSPFCSLCLIFLFSTDDIIKMSKNTSKPKKQIRVSVRFCLENHFSVLLSCVQYSWSLLSHDYHAYRIQVRSFQMVSIKINFQSFDIIWSQEHLLDRCVSL